jgi:hypothetical protein
MPCKGNQYPTYGEICGGPLRLNVCSKSYSITCNLPNFSQIYQSRVAISSFPSSTTKSSTTSSLISQPTVPPVGGYNYVGCYTEATSGRALNLASKIDKAMTLQECASYCIGLNYPMFGVEYSTEVSFLYLLFIGLISLQCYCGTYNRKGSVPAPATDCKMACGGSNTEICGGSNRLSTYAIKNYVAPSIPQTFAGYSYAGCYTESTTSRALASSTSTNYNSMTLNICAAFCRDYSMWGIEYGGEASRPALFLFVLTGLLTDKEAVPLRQYPRRWKRSRSRRR